MTNAQRLQTELTHLLRLLNPPLPAWEEFVERKANALAAMSPDVYQALPEMLRAARSSNRSTSTAGCSGEQEKSE